MARRSGPIRLNHEIAKSEDEIIRLLKAAAESYNRYLNKKLLFIFHENKKDPIYDCYEVFFGKENFIHLSGFSRGDISALEFFDKCLDGSLLLKEARYSENVKSASAKLDVLSNLLDYKNAVIYRMGEADFITLKNRFEVAIGRDNGLMGFDKRKNGLPIPVTVIKGDLYDYVSTPQKVVAVLAKNKYDEYYDTLLGGPKQGLVVSVLPEKIRKKLSPNVSAILK